MAFRIEEERERLAARQEEALQSLAEKKKKALEEKQQKIAEKKERLEAEKEEARKAAEERKQAKQITTLAMAKRPFQPGIPQIKNPQRAKGDLFTTS